MKFFFIFFLCFSCLGCGPIYRINSDTNLEAGFMNVCWMRDGRADYSSPTICSNPEEILFTRERIPLSVYSAFSDHNLTESINWINSELGCDIFRFTASSSHPDVRVYLAVALSSGASIHGATSHLRLAGGRIVANIETYMLSSDWSIQYTLEHELLHAVGLAHDDFDYSVMQPNTRRSMTYHITAHDRRILRERYCD